MSNQSSIVSRNGIYIPNLEFSHIRQLAYDLPQGANVGLDLYNEKKEMHLSSQKAVKNWGNTLLGQRKKKLISVEEKARLAEEQRVAVDKDWAILQAQERNIAIERARNLQRMESPKYKSFHSQLLLQSVLMERDLQIERKSQGIEMKKQKSNYAPSNPFLKSMEEEAMDIEADHINRLEIAAYQKSQREQKKNLESSHKKAEFEYYVNLNKDNSKDLSKDKDTSVKKALQFKENYGRDLENIIKSKKRILDLAKEESRILDLENERFQQRKSFIAAKHKELVESRSDAAQHIHDKIAPLAYDAENEKKNKIEEFIQKGISARLNEQGLDRNLMEKESRDAVLRDINLFRHKQLEVKKKKAIIGREEELVNKKMIDEQYAQYVLQNQAIAEKKNSENLRYKELQLEQIKQKTEQTALAQKQKALDHAKDNLKDKIEEAEFDTYAKNVLDDWESAGRPTHLISQSIQKLKEHRPPKERYVEGIKLDTFARLGFS